MTETIIFCHTNYRPYLEHVIRQARRSNPNARIVLLGTDENKRLGTMVEHRMLSDFESAVAPLREKYVHLSSNSAQFELFCIARHFVIAAYCRAEGVAHFLHADSDLLIHSDIADVRRRFAAYDFTLSGGMSPHAMFWNTAGTIQTFADYVMQAYASHDAPIMQRLRAIYANLTSQGLPGGVCDMTLLELFASDGGFRAGETTEISEGRTLDHNINMAINGAVPFAMSAGIKDIRWRDGSPYGTRADTGELVRFDVLHCQGKAKRHIRSLAHGRAPGWLDSVANLAEKIGARLHS